MMAISRGVRLENKSNVTVMASQSGAGIKSTGRPTQGVQGFGPVLFVVRLCTNCRIQGLYFEGNNVDISPIGFDRCTNTVFEGNTVARVGGNVTGGMLSATGNTRNQYLRNTFDRGNRYGSNEPRGMWVGNATPTEYEWYPTLAGNTVRYAAGTGIALHSIGATLADNVIEYAGGAGVKIVPIAGQAAVTTIERNTFRRNKFSGLQMDQSFSMTVRNNLAEQNDGPGIFVYGGLANSSITNNTVRDNNYDKLGGWQGGIYIHHALNSVISDNQIYETRSGTARSQDNAIILNAVTPGGIQNVRLTNNVCRNHTENGISIQNNGSGSISGVQLSGNSCNSNARYGLDVYEKYSGAIRNITEGGNNFDSNGSGRIFDNTLQRLIYSIVTPIQNLLASILSPSNGATVSGTISLSASVTSGSPITSVQFKVDGSNYGAALTTPPFSMNMNTAHLSNGNHMLSVAAVDSSGATVQSATTSFTINNPVSSPTPTNPTPTPTPTPTNPGSEQAFVTKYVTGSTVTGGYTGWAGMRIRIGGAPITITHLGRWKLANNVATHTVKVVNAATGADVPGATAQVGLNGQANGTFIFGALASPVTLAANTDYMVVSSEQVAMNNGDFFHDFNGALTVTTAAQVQGAVFWNGSRWQALGSANQSIGPVSFRYR